MNNGDNPDIAILVREFSKGNIQGSKSFLLKDFSSSNSGLLNCLKQTS